MSAHYLRYVPVIMGILVAIAITVYLPSTVSEYTGTLTSTLFHTHR